MPTPQETVEAWRETYRSQGLNESDLPFIHYQADLSTGLLLLHGSAATPCNHRALGQLLLGQGLSVVAPLMAGHENPTLLQSGAISWQDCYRSAEYALDFLSQFVQKVFVVGSSFGGSLAYLLGIHRPDKVSGVIALSAPALNSDRYRPSSPWMHEVTACTAEVEHSLHNLQLPTLVLHGADDPSVKVKNALYAYEQISAPCKKMILYQGMGHSLGFGFNTPEVAGDISRFVRTCWQPMPVRFELADHGFESVYLSGEFNGWAGHTLPLKKAQGVWSLQLDLPPGVHQYKLVINGQSWILDPQADSVLTPYGERNSVVRVGY
jgi:esterase/lipase